MRKTLYGKIIVALAFAFLVSASGFVAAQDGLKNRLEIDPKYTWNLEEIYPAKDAWEKDCSRIESDLMPKMAKFQGKLKDAKSILACFKAFEDLFRLTDKAYVYAQSKSDENQGDSGASEMRSRMETLAAKVGAARAFIKPELLELPVKTLRGYMKDPSFKDYRFMLESILEKKPHTLSKKEEELVAGMSDVAGAMRNIYEKLTYADKKYPTIKDENGKEFPLSEGSYQLALQSKDRDFRRRAFENLYAQYESTKNTYADLMNFEVKKDVFFARAHKYNSALDAALAEEFVPRSVYDNLVKSVNNNVGYLHRYVTLRKKILGVDRVRIYDMYVPLVENYRMNIPIEDAKVKVVEGLAPLGKDYLANFRRGLDGRWIDVYETAGKRNGGYCTWTYDIHPYVLMNYNGTIDAAMTLAHEMGHAMHAVYSDKTQAYVNSDPPIFLAEVASTANEMMMARYLIKNAKSDDEKLFLINHLMEQIRGAVYTQVMYSEFEAAIHDRVEKGEALSNESLRTIWGGLMKKYYGADFALDDLATLWWARIHHFYSAFYVYKYATSISASNALVKNIDEGRNSAALKKYFGFLSAGGSDYPIEILARAGVDMRSTAPVDTILADFGSLLDQMESILRTQGKIQ